MSALEPGHPTRSIPSGLEDVLTRLGSNLSDFLKEDLVGVYLHGSAVLGGFRPEASDIDLVIVVETTLSLTVKSGLTRLLWRASGQLPGRGLECWVVTRTTVASGGADTAFELLISTHPREPRTVDGADHPAEGLLVDLSIVRNASYRVKGPPAKELIEHIPREKVYQEMAVILDEALKDAPESFGVLVAARSLRFLETGDHVSKIEAGEWAVEQGQTPDLIRHALEVQQGLALDRPITRAGRRYVEEVIQRLEAAPSTS